MCCVVGCVLWFCLVYSGVVAWLRFVCGVVDVFYVYAFQGLYVNSVGFFVS